MKRCFLFALGLSALVICYVLSLSWANSTYATYGFHGMFAENADTCTGCHRSHTLQSVASEEQLATTLTTEYYDASTTTSTDSCLTCHGADATGAYTDVVYGVFETADKSPVSDLTTESQGGGQLNGGGFGLAVDGIEVIWTGAGEQTLTSRHEIDGGPYTAWGGGLGGPGTDISMECTSCHNIGTTPTHQSSNYRMLKEVFFEGTPNEVNVTGFVKSNETNFPEQGFLVHTTFGNYVPDYTRPYYKNPPQRTQGISGWCVACHAHYTTDSEYIAPTYDPQTGNYIWKSGWRHRHNISGAYMGRYNDYTGHHVTTTLPLDQATRTTSQDAPGNYLNCLTCHRAHGTAVEVSGDAFIAPSNDSALLRLPNRGVCEDCHKK